MVPLGPLAVAMLKLRLELQARMENDEDFTAIWLACQWFASTLILYVIAWYAYVSSHILGSVITGLFATASLFLEIFMLVSYKGTKKETKKTKFHNTPVKPTKKFGADYW